MEQYYKMCIMRGETRKFSVKYKMSSSGFIFNAAIGIYIVAILLVYLAKKLKKIPIPALILQTR